MLALLAATAPLSVSLGGLAQPLAPQLRAAPAAMSLTELSPSLEHISELVANAGAAAPITPLLISELSVAGVLFAGGNWLHTFGDVDEPKEEGMYAEGELDIYRDSPLRYMGYVNEMGEAFRPLVPVEVVYFTYVLAIGYILADTIDKGTRGAKLPGSKSGLRAIFGGVDTFLWQMQASVVFPSFVINRLVTLIVALQAGYGPFELPEELRAGWIATVLGLASIPVLIVPLDVLAHWCLNGSFRQLSSSVLADKAEAGR